MTQVVGMLDEAWSAKLRYAVGDSDVGFVDKTHGRSRPLGYPKPHLSMRRNLLPDTIRRPIVCGRYDLEKKV